MASPAVTYTFTNSTTADATQVNQNFSDLISGMTDGSKSFSIDALTVAGACLLNGTVGLGNATADDITFTGYVASAITPKTDDTYDLGTAALAWQDLYLDGSLYTDTISELGSGVGVTIDSVLVKDGGISLATTGGTATALNYYQTDDVTFAAVAWKPNGAASAIGTSLAAQITRIGRIVTIFFPTNVMADPAGTTTLLELRTSADAAIVLPAWARPAGNLELLTTVANAGLTAVGEMYIQTTGTISLYLCPAASWTNGTNQAGTGAISVSYSV